MVYLLLDVWLFIRRGDHGVVFVVQPFLSLPGFKNGGFDFCKRAAHMTHRVTTLTSQCSLLTSHFRIASDHLGRY